MMDDIANKEANTGRVKRSAIWVGIILAALLIASIVVNIVLWSKYQREKEVFEELDSLFSANYYHFTSITVDIFEEKVASGEEFIVLISRPGCINCQRLEVQFIQLAGDKGIKDRIYYLNVALLRRDADAWAKFREAYEFEGTPTFIRFKSGKNISSVGWTNSRSIEYEMVVDWINAQGDFFMDLQEGDTV